MGISEATIKNWVNQGYISTIAGQNKFDAAAVELLKDKITTGKIDRLRRRANKKSTDYSYIPDEYLEDVGFIAEIERIRAIFIAESLDISLALFVLTVKQLVLRNELIINFSQIFSKEFYQNSLKKVLTDEITAWLSELSINNKTPVEAYSYLFATLTDASHDDTIGIIYQSLMMAGNKSKQGSFYTPRMIIDDIFKDFSGRPGSLIDPCCGTGQFLLRAARQGYNDPNRLFGIDIDGLAVKIARINIILIFPDVSFSPKIFHADSLLEKVDGKPFSMQHFKQNFTLVATNPPWGADFSDDDLTSLNKQYLEIKSHESFSYFLSKSLELATEGAVISFILPESFLNIKVHSDIREFLLAKVKILAIHSIGRQFKGVYTPVVRLDLLNEPPIANWSINIRKPDKATDIIPQTRFVNNRNYIFDVGLSEEENQIIKKLYSIPYLTLKNNADWALGIVTGDNNKFISDIAEEGMEAIYRGSDVMPYFLKTAKYFIKFTPENFQQVAPTAKYRAPEKLIYKFISNRLVFAYDDRQAMTLNSANILIPKFKDYSAKVVLCLLNSKLFRFIFSKKFNTHKVLRGDLETLPLPLLSAETQTELGEMADEAIKGAPVADVIDKKIMQVLGFSETQRDLILQKFALE